MLQGEKLKKIIHASKLYYQMDYSQQEIAKKLGVSRPTVSRFLQQAKEEGIVQIKINDPTEDCELLAEQIKERFQLNNALVAAVPQYEENIVKTYLGVETANICCLYRPLWIIL
jgi:deoxyribonucleoside regulator